MSDCRTTACAERSIWRKRGRPDLAKILRLLIAVLIVAFPVFLGWHFRSPLVIPLLGVIYVPLYLLGKAGTGRVLGCRPSRIEIAKAVLLTFAVQCGVVGVFYLVGLGLAALITDRAATASIAAQDLAWIGGFAVVTVPITGFIAFEERARGIDGPKDVTQASNAGDEFDTLDRRVTATTFYSGWHFSRPNYTRTALVDVVDHQGAKPVRAPKWASEAMIAQTEARLGVKFPQTLRDIYMLQNGGGLPVYYVPKYEGAPHTYDDWVSAFADDYNDLRPLGQLKTLHDDYMEYFDPDYDDPAQKDEWLRGAEHLVILTARTGYGTALDYRGGGEPGVLLFDNNRDAPELKRFDNFDAFLAALREVGDRYGGAKGERKDVAFGAPPDATDPDRFWSKGSAGAGVTADEWGAAGKSLGVTLPATLLPFYAAANGGLSRFNVALAETEEAAPLHVFPTGPYVYAGLFSKLEHFASLATLSDRLEFVDGRTPWRDLYDLPDKLIVISAAYDSAILLDYRQGDTPAVIAVEDLDALDAVITFPTAEAFVNRLRQFGVPKAEEKNEIGDDRISARGSDATTFWLDSAAAPVEDAALQAFKQKWGYENHGLPNAIKGIYLQANGGPVRFRFAPPQQINAYGHAVTDMPAKRWIDVFPNGLLPN